VLVLKRSILTEKISRRGYHLSREYSIDPLEILFTREVMRTDILALPATIAPGEVGQRIRNAPNEQFQRLYPVVDSRDHLLGVVTRNTLQSWIQAQQAQNVTQPIGDLVQANPAVAYADEPLRTVVEDVEGGQKLVGMVSLYDLLKARTLNLEAERRRERFLPLHVRFPRSVTRDVDAP
jgi:chloride channel protein, CIC family